MKRRHWVTAAAVIGFELWAASLMLSPQVSADYRQYYLERSTDCWPVATSGAYRLGDTLSFRDDAAGLASRRFKTCGWVTPFSAGTWSKGDRARLHFAFDVPPQGVVVALLAQGYIGGDHLAQRVEVEVNGVRVDDLVFTPQTQGLATVLVGTDVAALDPKGLNIQFQFPDRISPLEMGLGEDKRELGMLIEEMMIVAPPDP